MPVAASGAPAITAGTNAPDVASWSIAQLKSYLHERSISFADCVEKCDFAGKVRAQMSAPRSPAAPSAPAPSAPASNAPASIPASSAPAASSTTARVREPTRIEWRNQSLNAADVDALVAHATSHVRASVKAAAVCCCAL